MIVAAPGWDNGINKSIVSYSDSLVKGDTPEMLYEKQSAFLRNPVGFAVKNYNSAMRSVRAPIT